MAAPYANTAPAFRNLNIAVVVAFNGATALWGANVSNTVLTIFSSKQSTHRKLLVAWLCALTTMAQTLGTVQLKKDYVNWGFIDVDVPGTHKTLQNMIFFVSALTSTTCDAFLGYQVWLYAQTNNSARTIGNAKTKTEKNAKRSKGPWILGGAAVLLSLEFVPPLGSLLAPAESTWARNSKTALLASLALQLLTSTLLCAGLGVVWWRLYFSGARNDSALRMVLNGLLFALNTNACVVLVGLGGLGVFYLLYAYTPLFLLYAHLLTALRFTTVLSIVSTHRPRRASSPSDGSSGGREMKGFGGGGFGDGMGPKDTGDLGDSGEPWSVARRSQVTPIRMLGTTQLTGSLRFHHSLGEVTALTGVGGGGGGGGEYREVL